MSLKLTGVLESVVSLLVGWFVGLVWFGLVYALATGRRRLLALALGRELVGGQSLMCPGRRRTGE